MKIAYYIRKGEFKYFDFTENLLEDFKKKYKGGAWRLVNVESCQSKKDAFKLARATIKERLKKYELQDCNGDYDSKKDAFCKITGSLKTYLKLKRDFKPYQPTYRRIRTMSQNTLGF